MMIGLGFAGVISSHYLSNAIQLATGDFITLWTEAFLVCLFGFVVVVAGFLIAGSEGTRCLVGGILGILGSFVGAFVSLALVMETVGLAQSASGFSSLSLNSAQMSTSYEILFIGCILILFVGFPLAVFGSVPGILVKKTEPIESGEPST